MSIDDISKAVLLLLRLGAAARLIYCFIRIGATDEQTEQYKKRAKNTVIFYIIAESIWAIKDMILWYYR